MWVNMWKFIRLNKNKSIMEVAQETNISRQNIYLFENGKTNSNKLMAYYLRLNGRDIDIKLASILEEDYETYFKEIKEES